MDTLRLYVAVAGTLGLIAGCGPATDEWKGLLGRGQPGWVARGACLFKATLRVGDSLDPPVSGIRVGGQGALSPIKHDVPRMFWAHFAPELPKARGLEFGIDTKRCLPSIPYL